VVVFPVKIGVFNGGLGFADAAESADGRGLDEGSGLAGEQHSAQVAKNLFAACEEWVAPERDMPDGRLRRVGHLRYAHRCGAVCGR
jgi:hypothetical protein